MQKNRQTSTRELSTAEAMRYNRQIMIPGFDLDKQEILLSARVLIVGAGGLGCSAAQFLCAAGTGHISVMDDDTVEITNLQRQILHFEKDVGLRKACSAKDTLKSINSGVSVDAIIERASEDNLPELIESHDIVLDCSDNLDTRNLLNRLCYEHGTSLVSGAAIRMEGQIFCVIPEKRSACYACISRFFGELNLSCVESGIMSPVVGIVGASQALEAIKILCDFGKPAINQLQVFDAMQSHWQNFNVNAQDDCAVCSSF
uniref:molybdopterin-synthase adenylyltransferase MoeB n=1 Tax=Ningiella ruwaisensis TaxID=2364274 RepID=UPI00109F39BE|nr:molybdopterin-synthase adenylyltransferase MoeB [Ningiella ruwaisensis]